MSIFSIFRNKIEPDDAERLLKAAGYEVTSRQPKRTVIAAVNGQDHAGYLQADYLVKRAKEKFVAIIKQGEGNDPAEPIFRRKLLELSYIFDPDALLLLDLNEGRIDRVDYSFPRERNIDAFFRALIWIAVILGVLGLIWLLTVIRLF